MNRHYEDILKLSKKPPIWFDEHAVPRFCKFHPTQVANIYARACALVLIACQSCGARFKVAFSWSGYDSATPEMERLLHSYKPPKTLDEVRAIHYGDPPNTECCGSGPSMNCVDLRVLQWWTRFDNSGRWQRQKRFEIPLESEGD